MGRGIKRKFTGTYEYDDDWVVMFDTAFGSNIRKKIKILETYPFNKKFNETVVKPILRGLKMSCFAVIDAAEQGYIVRQLMTNIQIDMDALLDKLNKVRLRKMWEIKLQEAMTKFRIGTEVVFVVGGNWYGKIHRKPKLSTSKGKVNDIRFDVKWSERDGFDSIKSYRQISNVSVQDVRKYE